MDPHVTGPRADSGGDHPIEVRRLLRELDLAMAAGHEAERRLDERFAELALLTRRLRAAEAAAAREADHRRWLAKLNVALEHCPRRWALMPRGWQRRRKLTMLRRRGLFDADAYVARYPDVVTARIDPLRHYLLYGLDEDRRR